MTTIASLRSAINAQLDTMAGTMGEQTELTSQSQLDTVSFAVDSANETWNNDLPPRPAK